MRTGWVSVEREASEAMGRRGAWLVRKRIVID